MPKSLYNLTEKDYKLYQEFYRRKEKIDRLHALAKRYIIKCAESLCDVTMLLPGLVESLPTEKGRAKARKIIRSTFI